MASQLDKFRKDISKDLLAGLSDLEIEKNLNALGCRIGRERIRTWIIEEQRKGKLPRRTRRNLSGRPKATRQPSFEAVEIIPGSAPFDTVLFLTGQIATARIPQILQLFPRTADSISDQQIWGQIAAAGLPQVDGEIDLETLAREMGPEKVNRVSELEYFLLAMTRPVSRETKQGTSSWIRSVAKEAFNIRQTMRQAVCL